MKNLFITSLLSICLCAFVNGQGLDGVLESYFKTTGQEFFNKVKTMEMTGISIAQGMENDILIKQKRPEKLRMEIDIQGMIMVQAYDGKKGWVIAPWSGSSEPSDLTGSQLQSLIRQADFEGPLYNWKKKGHTATFSGTSKVEGSEVYEINLELTNGDINVYYIDAETFVLIKMKSKDKDGDNITEAESYYSNYKKIDNILFPFCIENRVNGQMISQLTITSIEFGKEMDDSIFSKPVTAPGQK